MNYLGIIFVCLLFVILGTSIFIIKKISKMSTEVKDVILAQADRTSKALANIRKDIKVISDGINKDGLTAEEAAEVKAKLLATADDAEELDKENAGSDDTTGDTGTGDNGAAQATV